MFSHAQIIAVLASYRLATRCLFEANFVAYTGLLDNCQIVRQHRWKVCREHAKEMLMNIK